VVNHFYFYCVDADFGPFFLKFCSYFPYNAKLCINGNEWAKRQAAKAGIGFTALDNGFATCEDPAGSVVELSSDRVEVGFGVYRQIGPFGKYWRSIPFDPPMFVKRPLRGSEGGRLSGFCGRGVWPGRA
jgi:hypothetical protein